ncbi:MAG: glycosyltransferase family 4 protein [Methylococcales bacterium]
MNVAYIANPSSIHDCKWINYFAKRYNVIVICSEAFVDSSYLNESVKVYRMLPEFPHKNIIKRNKTISSLKRIIKREKVEIIHTMYSFPNAFWVNLISFKNHIITTRGSDVLVDYKGLFNPLSSYSERLTNNYFIKQFHDSFNSAKFITSTSISQQTVVKEFVKDTGKLKLIRTGIDVSRFLKGFEKKMVTSDEIVIFSPRSMMPIYNIDIIIYAFNDVLKTYYNTKLVIINDVPNEPYADKMLALILKLGLSEKCIVTSKLSKQEMASWYIKSDIVVSIPKTDGSPNSVLEAMLAKKSVIMGDYAYDPQLFSGIPKLNANTKEELTSRIIELIKNPFSDKELNSNYRRVVQIANVENSTKEVEQLYLAMLSKNKVMKIHTLFIAAWYPNDRDETHGNFIKEHAKSIASFAKVSVVFIQFNKIGGLPNILIKEDTEGLLSEYYITINSPVRRFDVHDLLIKKAYKSIIKKIEAERRIDICHINVRDVYTKSVLDLKELNYPVVITEHFSHYHTGIYRLDAKGQEIERRDIKSWFSDKRIKVIMPVSKQLGEVLVDDFEVDKDKIIVIPNIASDCFYYKKKEKNKNIKLVLVANWHQPKNPILFLKCLTKISDNILDKLEIEWVGNGTQMDEVKLFFKNELKEVNVRFYGRKSKEFIADKFRAADFFVHPTDAENLPTVIIESLCCGTPVLTHNVNGIPELVNESNGIMCEAKNVELFRIGFLSMIDSYLKYDNEKIALAAQNKFNTKPVSSQFKKVYIEALK